MCVCVSLSKLEMVKLNTISPDVSLWWIPCGATLHYKLAEWWLTSGERSWPRCRVRNNPVTFDNENNPFCAAASKIPRTETSTFFLFFLIHVEEVAQVLGSLVLLFNRFKKAQRPSRFLNISIWKKKKKQQLYFSILMTILSNLPAGKEFHESN